MRELGYFNDPVAFMPLQYQENHNAMELSIILCEKCKKII